MIIYFSNADFLFIPEIIWHWSMIKHRNKCFSKAAVMSSAVGGAGFLPWLWKGMFGPTY